MGSVSTPAQVLGKTHTDIIETLLRFEGLSKNHSKLAALISKRIGWDGIIIQSQESMALNDIKCALATVKRGVKKLIDINFMKKETPKAGYRFDNETCNYVINMETIWRLIKKYWKRLIVLFPGLIKMTQGRKRREKLKMAKNTNGSKDIGKTKMTQGAPIYLKVLNTNTPALPDIQNKFNASDQTMEKAIRIAENHINVVSGKIKFTRMLKGILKNIVPGYKENLRIQESSNKAAKVAVEALKQHELEEKQKKTYKIDFSKLKIRGSVVRRKMTRNELKLQAERMES